MVAIAGAFLDVDGVVAARELRQREPRVQVDRDRHRVHVAVARGHERGRDAVGVRDLECRRRPARALARRRRRGARNVAWRDREREAQAERAVVVAQRLLVFERDDDFLARSDVGNVRREHVRPFLLDERRLASVGLRGLVGPARLGALLDLPLDHALADVHRQVVDGGLVRQRKHVHAFAPLRGRIGEALRDLHARDHPADVHVHIGRKQRRRRPAARRLAQQQRALARVVAARRVCLEADDEHGEGEHQADEQARCPGFPAPAGRVGATRCAGRCVSAIRSACDMIDFPDQAPAEGDRLRRWCPPA